MMSYQYLYIWRLIVLIAFIAFGSGCSKEDNPAQSTESPSAVATEIKTKTGMEMVLIPAGEFVMGDEKSENDERPAHKVRISAFYIDKYEVTQKVYESLMGKNPAKFKGPDRPVEQISWLGAVRFCNMRSAREGLTPCYDPQTLECNYQADGYRLPTETEWEYACRAGTTTRYSFGNNPGQLKQYAWFKDNTNKSTHPVGQKKSNSWGLYDMHGNVWEWCGDYYSETYYQQSPPADPRGPSAGMERVLRGGSWAVGAESCRSATRYNENPGLADVCFGYEAYGFRSVRRAAPKASGGGNVKNVK